MSGFCACDRPNQPPCRNDDMPLITMHNDGLQWSAHECAPYSPYGDTWRWSTHGRQRVHREVDAIAAQLAWWMPATATAAKPGGALRLPDELARAQVAADAEHEASSLDATDDVTRRIALRGDAIFIRGQIQPEVAWIACSYRPMKYDAALARTDPEYRHIVREHLARQEALGHNAASSLWVQHYRWARNIRRLQGTAAV